MVTWEGMSLSFLQKELILGHGTEEHEGHGGVLRRRDEMLGKGGTAQATPGQVQGAAMCGAEPCGNVLQSQQEGRIQDPAFSALWGTSNPPL